MVSVVGIVAVGATPEWPVGYGNGSVGIWDYGNGNGYGTLWYGIWEW